MARKQTENILGETLRVDFIARENGPERLVCDAELVFMDGPLADMKLTGFSLWRGADAATYVTFPSRAFGAGTERKYFDYLRSVEGTQSAVKRVKDWIVDQYKLRQQPAA
jgi:hypothetical protein